MFNKIFISILFIGAINTAFASFPIQEDIRFIDTVLVNEKLNEAVVVDSTSKYPLEKETLTEYRARLKKQLYSSSSEKTKYSFGAKVLLIVILLIVIIMIAVIFSDSSSSRSSSNTSYTLDDFFPDP